MNRCIAPVISQGRQPGVLGTVGLLVAALLSGCANSLVYDERRDKQAQEARKLAAESRIGDTVAALEKSFGDVASMEETRARGRAAYLFDLELRVVSGSQVISSEFESSKRTRDGLQTVVTNRLATIGLIDPSPGKLEELRGLAPVLRARQDVLESTLIEFHGTVGRRFESCREVYAVSSDEANKSEKASDSFVATLPANRQQLAQLKFPALVQDCRRVDEALEERGKLLRNGLVQAIHARHDRVQADVMRYDLEMKRAQEELDKAGAAGTEVSAEAVPGAKGKLETVEARARRLREVVHELAEGSKSLGRAGEHAVAAERLARLEAVLGAIAGTPPEGEVQLSTDERVSVAIIRDIAALADEADKLLTEAKRPRLVPFVAAIEQQRLVLQEYEAGRLAKRKQLSAIGSELQAVLNEADALSRVLEPLTQDTSWAQRSIKQLLDDLPPEKKVGLLRALAVYADEVKQYRIEEAAWKVRAEAAQYEVGLARSKYAAARWDALTDTIATVLADYHASGIKRADLAEFFKALGLVTIGIGAAQ